MMLIICRPLPNYGRTVRWCTPCGRRRRTLVLVEHWHGQMSVCCTCRNVVNDAGRDGIPDSFEDALAASAPLSQVMKAVDRRSR